MLEPKSDDMTKREFDRERERERERMMHITRTSDSQEPLSAARRLCHVLVTSVESGPRVLQIQQFQQSLPSKTRKHPCGSPEIEHFSSGTMGDVTRKHMT